jgi:ABC-2 type transport system ATP-binding protein
MRGHVMGDTVIRCDALTKYYGKSRGIEDLTFEVRPGQVYGFLGPNGAGKTTTIRCLLSMLRPTSGKAYLFGQEVGVDGRELRRRIGYVAGDVALFEKQTGQWMIDYVSGLRGRSGPSAKELCDRLQFDPKRRIRELSKGNKQKLALVLAMMHDPELLILDEPTSGLDPLNQQVVFDMVEERTAAGATLFLSSHILSEVQRVCERVAIIRAGSVVAEESVKSLLDKSLRTATVTYTQPVTDDMLQGIPGATSVERVGETGITATIASDIDGAVRKLMERPISDIEIEHATLEEIFLEYYGHIEGDEGQ